MSPTNYKSWAQLGIPSQLRLGPNVCGSAMRSDFHDRFGRRGPPRRDDEPNSKRGRFENASDTYEPQFNRKTEGSGRVMLTFRKFLETQDEGISDDEAILKYNEYKFEYRKQEYEKFFQSHKDEEWFQRKYHPELSKESAAKADECVNKRLEIYKEVVEKDYGKDIELSFEHTERIVKFLDAVVIKLEGGTDEDVEVLLKEPVFDESLDDLRNKLNKTNGEVTNGNGNSNGVSKAEPEESEEIQNLVKKLPFRTHSIFLKGIPATAKFEEIENECKNYPGFLRLGLSEPLADQKFQRRAWVTFKRDVKIKDIFWNMKNAKFSDTEVSASVNRDLRRRVRVISGLANHRPIVQNDIRQAARLIALYDYKRKVYAEEGAEEQVPPKDLDALVSRSKNPVLDGVVEYFVEECNAEEEELLGVNNQASDDLKFTLEVDKDLFKYLDRLLVYLRVVHSVDFYNQCEYANEDTMPNRMGIVHVRDFPPDGEQFGKSETGVPLVPKKNCDQYISSTEEKLKASILKYEVIPEEDLLKLGKKDPEQAVEDFIKENSQELSKDKWLCPLSGKKFKGPEFIRKHLFSKHEHKIDEARSNAIYYNNYIADFDRPHNLELKPPPTPTVEEVKRPQEDRFGGHRNSWGPDRRFNNGPRFGGRGDFGNRGRFVDDFGTGRRDPRQPPTYRDLDAPDDII
uniref:Serrate RNA effector molecule homolog n=1 Tax=Bursaphelenchus xylophilus TaxID=6326 RepID=A0A1I7SMA9_BURXY